MAKPAPSRVAAALQYLQQMRDRAAEFGGGVVENLADRARSAGGLAYEALTSDPNLGRMTTSEFAQAADRPTPRLDAAARDLGTIGRTIVTQPVETGKAIVSGEIDRARGAKENYRAAGEYAGSFIDPMRIAGALSRVPMMRLGDAANIRADKVKQLKNQALGKEFPEIDETTGDFFYPENQSIVISKPNNMGNYGKNLSIERKVGDGKIRLTAKIEDMPFSDEPSRMSASLEALGDAPRGTGAATKMYLEALAIAQAQGAGFVSDITRSDAAENIYRRLINKGIPFKKGTGYDEGLWVLSADDLAKLDFSKLVDD